MNGNEVVGVATDREGNVIVVTKNGRVFEFGYRDGSWTEHDPVPKTPAEQADLKRQESS